VKFDIYFLNYSHSLCFLMASGATSQDVSIHGDVAVNVRLLNNQYRHYCILLLNKDVWSCQNKLLYFLFFSFRAETK